MIYLHGFSNSQQNDSFGEQKKNTYLFFTHSIPCAGICLCSFAIIHIKCGTFTPLESTDYSNFFIPFKQKRNFFSSLFIVLYIWLLSSFCRKRRLRYYHRSMQGTSDERQREKWARRNDVSQQKWFSPRCFFFHFFKCDNKLSMQLYAIFRSFFFPSSLYIRPPHPTRRRVSEWSTKLRWIHLILFSFSSHLNFLKKFYWNKNQVLNDYSSYIKHTIASEWVNGRSKRDKKTIKQKSRKVQRLCSMALFFAVNLVQCWTLEMILRFIFKMRISDLKCTTYACHAFVTLR